ncbi:MAG: hypothetical protein SGCHY_000116 [Lobulomycetales sp.]
MDVIDTATSHDLPTQERLRHRSSSASIARERLSDALNDIDDFIDSLPGSDVSEDSSLAELPRTPSEDLAPPDAKNVALRRRSANDALDLALKTLIDGNSHLAHRRSTHFDETPTTSSFSRTSVFGLAKGSRKSSSHGDHDLGRISELPNDENSEDTLIKPKLLSPAGSILKKVASKPSIAYRTEQIKEYTKDAENGDSSAQLKLGESYLRTGLLRDSFQGVKWLGIAAENGNNDAHYPSLEHFHAASETNEKACYYIGHCHYFGLGPYLKDYSEAIRWFRRSEAYKKSANGLGNCYFFGYGVSRDYATALLWYQRAAAQSCIEAYYHIGVCYRHGYGVEADQLKAFEYFQLSSKGNNQDAKFYLAVAYHHGYGVAENPKYATKLYLEAAESGNSQAQNVMGEFFEFGRGVAQDYTAAAQFYQRAATKGNSDAQCNLASLYQRGLGVKHDLARAFQIFKKAADNGNGDAMYNIGLCYHSGVGAPLNRTVGVEWFQLSAEQGNHLGQFALGKCYYWGIGICSDFEDAVAWFKKSADKGNTDSMYYLGLCYQKGRGVPQNFENAMVYFRRSAGSELGHADSELAIGKLLLSTFGNSDPDVEQASTWLEMSANKGNAEAQYHLGLLYYNGSGESIPVDTEKAAAYFESSANLGQADAQFMLGQCYEKGQAKAKSLALAKQWYLEAAAKGSLEVSIVVD